MLAWSGVSLWEYWIIRVIVYVSSVHLDTDLHGGFRGEAWRFKRDFEDRLYTLLPGMLGNAF